jgi:hypothetical protein
VLTPEALEALSQRPPSIISICTTPTESNKGPNEVIVLTVERDAVGNPYWTANGQANKCGFAVACAAIWRVGYRAHVPDSRLQVSYVRSTGQSDVIVGTC